MIIKQDFYYPPGDSTRCLHIYLPDDYDSTAERYPVMYFFDGHNLFYDSDATYGKSWGLKEFLDHWDKKMIVVGAECSHVGNQRLNEYCPYRKRMFGEVIEGIGDETFQWLVNDVKPMMDSSFRTYSHREATGIAGSSMGGLMSIYGVIRYNAVFSKAGCLSPGMYYNLLNLRRTLAESELHPDTRVYFSWGENEGGRAPRGGDPAYETREARSIRKFAGELGVMTMVYFQPDGNHCEADWEKQLPIFMNYLWK